MKFKEFCRVHKKKIVVISIASVLIIALAGGVIFYYFRNQGTGTDGYMQGNRNAYSMTQLEGMTAAAGVTSIGVDQISFDVENLTNALEVEETYVASDDEVQEGDRILKLTEESVATVRKELEETLQDAELAYRAGVIEYEQSKLEAEYERDSAILSGEQAAEIYQETLSGLSSSLERATQELEEAQEQIAEYQSYVNNDSYREYYQVDDYQALYDENLRLLQDKMTEWGATWSQVISGQGSMSSGGMSGGSVQTMSSVSGGDEVYVQTATSDQIQVLSSLYKVLEQNAQDLEQAQEAYEDAQANAAFELQTLELQLPSLQQAVTEAQEQYETRQLEAKLTYETSLANAERAENDYETAISQAESDYETLLGDYEDAKENLELFEKAVGDGYFYAPGSGSILRLMTRAGQELTSDSVILIYSNPEEMTVTVSVDQADIAEIQLGDSAYVQSTSYGGYDGTVTQIDPISSSDSRTSVTYNVTVTMSGEAGSMGSNESVTVVFGEENIETLKSMMSGMETTGDGEMSEGMPEGGFGDGEMPEGGFGTTDGTGSRPSRGEGQQGGRSNTTDSSDTE